MKKQHTRFILICAATLLVAYLSQLILFGAWHSFAIEGRVFRSAALMNVLGCVPFDWPFLVAGFLLACHSDRGIGALWLLIVGILGGILYSSTTGLLIPATDSVFNYPSFYVRYTFPLAFTVIGFVTGCLFPRNKVA